jgi:hypothetical protein
MTEPKQTGAVAFDETQGAWRVTASYTEPDNVVFYRHGEHFKTITWPGYKIWNILAHFDEIIEEFEDGLAKARWPL